MCACNSSTPAPATTGTSTGATAENGQWVYTYTLEDWQQDERDKQLRRLVSGFQLIAAIFSIILFLRAIFSRD